MMCELRVERLLGYMVFPQYALIKPVLQNHIAPGPALQLHLHLFLHLLQLLLHLYLDMLLYMPQHLRIYMYTCITRISLQEAVSCILDTHNCKPYYFLLYPKRLQTKECILIV
jgi:hypothetical protein